MCILCQSLNQAPPRGVAKPQGGHDQILNVCMLWFEGHLILESQMVEIGRAAALLSLPLNLSHNAVMLFRQVLECLI